jgi:hypothetical protein
VRQKNEDRLTGIDCAGMVDERIVCELPDRQTNPAVPLSSEQNNDNAGGDQNGEPDERDPRPRPVVAPVASQEALS